MRQLKKTSKCIWTYEEALQTQTPIALFGTQTLIENMDDKVLEQISNVARLPGLVGAAMTMPDAHWGYGFPVGGVAAFDAERGGVISAGGVGFDISCGIRCLRTNLELEQLLPYQENLAEELFRVIPSGVGREGKIKCSSQTLDDIMRQGAPWAVEHGYGIVSDLDMIEEKGCVPNAKPEYVSDLAKRRQHGEMGTLGSGNHYLEVQVVETIYDQQAAQAFGLYPKQIVISIHCGSRGLGHQIGTDYLRLFAKVAPKYSLVVPDKELSSAPIKTPEGQQYLGAMRAGINIALANRQILCHLTRRVMQHFFANIHVETLYDVSHNTCKVEVHEVDGQRKKVYIHRKGATRAFGPGHPELPDAYRAVGQPVIVGGSMGTGSFILAGNSSDENRAFASACHGAGRAMSRRQAAKRWRGMQVINDLARQGIIIRGRSLRDVAEEAPDAYKDLDSVVIATEQAKLARRVARLKPVVCIKG